MKNKDIVYSWLNCKAVKNAKEAAVCLPKRSVEEIYARKIKDTECFLQALIL